MTIRMTLLLLGCSLAIDAAAAPPFRVQRDAGRWQLVAPDGKPFFSRGVCCVNMGTARPDYVATKPAYAAWRQYEDPAAWAETTLERLNSWRFTTIGGWSDFTTLRRSGRRDVAFAPVLHVGSSAGAPWFDMWDPQVIRRMEAVARAQILPLRDDPRLLGYYSDNEMGWWNAALFKMTLEQKASSGQRRRLVRMLRAHYRRDWSLLLRDFEPEGAGSFADLGQGGVLFLRPGSKGIRVIRRFLGMAAERYYQLVRQVVRRYDRRGLLLGDRYQSFYYPEVARASRRSVDVVSTNLSAHWNDGTLARFYLDTLHALAGRPIMIGEFYMAARENRSGNKNDSSGFPLVQTQAERAEGFRTTFRALAQFPSIVGADWFQSYDEPTFGRDDGENYNFGLVDIHDRPYEALTQAAASLDASTLRAGSTASKRPDAFGGVPRAPAEPLAELRPWLALKDWDREHGFVPPASRFPVADLYLCWDKDALYLGLLAMDVVEAIYYKDGQIPEVDRMEWAVRLKGQPKPIHVRLGAGRAATVAGEGVSVKSLTGMSHHTRQVAVMRVPAAWLGRAKLAAGEPFSLSSVLLTHARAYRVEWRGEFKLAG